MLRIESAQNINIHSRLKEGRTYVVEIPYYTFTKYQGGKYTAFGKGVYKGPYDKAPYYYYLWNVTVRLRGTNITFNSKDVGYLCALLLHQRETFYDLEEIRENAQKAREQMEQRSVNMILKRLVNDEFQWP